MDIDKVFKKDQKTNRELNRMEKYSSVYCSSPLPDSTAAINSTKAIMGKN